MHVEKSKGFPAALLERLNPQVNGLGQHALEAQAGIDKLWRLQSIGIHLEQGLCSLSEARNAIGGKILVQSHALQGACSEIKVRGIVEQPPAGTDLGHGGPIEEIACAPSG